jgi:membrane-bound serine protease (ClpP class)
VLVSIVAFVSAMTAAGPLYAQVQDSLQLDGAEKTQGDGGANSAAPPADNPDVPPQPAGARFGKLITITSPIDDQLVSEVTNLALKLQGQSERENREAVLVLEILPGSSRFGQISDLARFLTSSAVSKVHTVAWLPESVDGLHGILALSCHEIAMHPDATLGDIGRGEALPADQQEFVLRLVDRRRNPRLSRGIAQAMLSPATVLSQITLEGPDGVTQKKFLTSEELRLLLDQNAVISKNVTLKEAGTPGVFHAADALRDGYLVSSTARNRQEVLAGCSLPLEALRTETSTAPVNVRVIEVHDMIEPILGDFVVREMQKAISEGSNLLIFDIDSPGGFVQTSEELALAISELDPAKVTTVAWIRREAISGAAVTALACDRILMHPEARLGDAGVIQETAEGGAFERAEEKVISPFLLFVGDLARRKNRPPALLQAMVDKDLEVFEATHRESGRVSYMSQFELDAAGDTWIKGRMVPESRSGLLLTLSGRRAHELGLAEAPCVDRNELQVRLGIPAGVSLQPLAKTWVDTLIFFLNSSFGSFLLITLAIICMYIELHLPSGFFGILAAVLFSVYFWSRFLGGTAGALELILFLLGLGLLALELFLIPGFGVFGVSGILLMLGALVMASHTFAGMSAGEGFEESLGSLGALGGALVTVVVVAMVLNRFLPAIPFLNRLILTPPGYAPQSADAPLLNPSLVASAPPSVSVVPGDRGVASTVLRPSGKATLGDFFVDVVSDGAFIEPGTPIEVIRVTGNRIVVRPADPGEPTSPDQSSDGLTA